MELLGGLEGASQIPVEATCGWEWLAELLEDAGYDTHLAHPLRTRAIAPARVKTFAVDGTTLAHLLRADLLPEAYIAPRENCVTFASCCDIARRGSRCAPR